MATYEATRHALMTAHPALYPTEAHVLHSLFCVNGKGYFWHEGQVVHLDGLPSRRQVRAQEVAFRKAHGLPARRSTRNWVQPPIAQLYPLWAHSVIAEVPCDVQPDWHCAAELAVQWAMTIPHTFHDHVYLVQARTRLWQLRSRVTARRRGGPPQPPVPPTRAAQQRQATIERHLQAYSTRTLPPPRTTRQVKRRATFAHRVIGDFLRRLRCLALQGNEVGWTRVALTPDDEGRREALERCWRRQQLPLEEQAEAGTSKSARLSTL